MYHVLSRIKSPWRRAVISAVINGLLIQERIDQVLRAIPFWWLSISLGQSVSIETETQPAPQHISD